VDLTQRGKLRFGIDTATLMREIQKNSWYVWDESPADLRVAQIRPVMPAEQRHPPSRFDPAEPVAASSTAQPSMPEAPPAPPATVRLFEVKATQSVASRPAGHPVVWFDIPARDIDRALRFYSAVLGMQLEKDQAGPGAAIAVLPHAQGSVGGCLIQNLDARPSESGPLLYLNADGRLDQALDAVEKNGGRVLSARHSIAPFGFRAIVLDSEGNRIALHSM
jgi:predicted enzyme related to lactoylglutathione lyase